MAVMVTNQLWYYAYMIRNKVLDEVRADYILLAKAKGLSKGHGSSYPGAGSLPGGAAVVTYLRGQLFETGGKQEGKQSIGEETPQAAFDGQACPDIAQVK